MSKIAAANHLFRQGRYREALSEYKRLLEILPELHDSLRVNIALCEARLGSEVLAGQETNFLRAGRKPARTWRTPYPIWLPARSISRPAANRGDPTSLPGYATAGIRLYETDLLFLEEPVRVPAERPDYFVSICVFASELHEKLRLTVQSIVLSLHPRNYSLTIICDWDGADRDKTVSSIASNARTIRHDTSRGFHKGVTDFIRRARSRNLMVVKSGVIFPPGAIYRLMETSAAQPDTVVLAPVTNNTLDESLQIGPSGSILLTDRRCELLYSRTPPIPSIVPSVEVFIFSVRALALVSFPTCDTPLDSAVLPLVSWFESLHEKGALCMVDLSSYAYSLNDRIATDQIVRSLRPASRSILERQLASLRALIDEYTESSPVLATGRTVCFFLQSLKLGGGGLVLANLGNSLIMLGFDVRFYAKHLDDSCAKGFTLLFKPKAYSHIDHVVPELPVNSVLVATLWTTAKDVETAARAVHGSRALYYVQDYEPLFYGHDTFDPAQRRFLEGARDSYNRDLSWIYTSDWVYAQLRSRHPDQHSYFAKINVGIDLSLFPPRHRRSESFCRHPVLTIGAMARPSTPRRGFELLIRSLSRLIESNPKVRIVFFGESNYSQHQIPFEFVDAGIVPPRDLGSLYAEFDIFLDTSDFQGFGLCALEAMSAGCACVVTRSGGVEEYAQDGFNCLLVNHEVDEIVSAITRIAKDPPLRSLLSANAVETSRSFDIINNALAWRNLLDSALPCIDKRESGCVVVVPIYNELHVARRCIESVIHTLRPVDELVLVDDSGDAYTADELRRIADSHHQIRLLRNAVNLGFVGAANRGLSFARERGKDAILLNSDTAVPPWWIERLVSAAYSGPVPSIVSPFSTSSSHLQLDVQPGASFLTSDRWLREHIDPRYPEIVTPEGWCILVPRAVYQRVGILDSAYGRGYCEESDLCMRAVAAGFTLRACDNLLVYHQGKVTFGDERGPLYITNRRLFDSRWSSLYRRIYAEFLKTDPLSSVREAYAHGFGTRPPHGNPAQFDSLASIIKHPFAKAGLRSLVDVAQPEAHNSRPVTSLAFLLPEFRAYGGVLSIVTLVNDLILSGVDAKIVVLKSKGSDGDTLGSLTPPLFLENELDLIGSFPQADLVVLTGWVTVYYAGLLNSHRPGFRYAYYIQDFEPDFPDVRRQSELYEAAITTYRLGLFSFCKTPWIRQKVATASGCKVHLVPPALDPDVFYRRDANGETYDVLAMFRPETEQRGSDTLLETIRTIKTTRPDVRIAIFGSDAPLLGFEEIIEKNFGRLENSQLPRVYSSTKVFLETSVFHGFGRTIAEAMACGTPCVITSSGGPLAFATDGINAIVRPVGDSQGLAAGVLQLLADPDLRAKVAQSARSAVADFHPKVSAGAIMDLLGVSSASVRRIVP